jgi:hypothetical protein
VILLSSSACFRSKFIVISFLLLAYPAAALGNLAHELDRKLQQVLLSATPTLQDVIVNGSPDCLLALRSVLQTPRRQDEVFESR